MSSAERAENSTKAERELANSLSAAQWNFMLHNERLPLSLLAPAQKEAVLTFLRLDFFDPEGDEHNQPTLAALSGTGVSLSLTGAGKTASLDIHADGTLPEGYYCGLPFYSDDGKLRYGIAPPR